MQQKQGSSKKISGKPLHKYKKLQKSKISNSKRSHKTAPKETLIGVISDTHGLLRPEALGVLQESSLIIHAGDIGNPEILTTLEAIAPVVVVRGNNDREAWADSFASSQTITIHKKRIFVIHNLKELAIDPAEQQISVVISGHSHQPKIEHRRGVLFLNPGSAGPRRFHLPIAVAQLRVSEKAVRARIITLD